MRTSIISMSLFSLCALAACSGGQDTQAANRAGPKKPASDNGTSNNVPSTDPIPTGGTDCASQWARAVSQMPVGSKFTYQSQIEASILGGGQMPSPRSETVTVSSDSAVTRTLDFSGSIIGSFVNSKTIAVSIPKDKFISTCAKNNGQPVTVTSLGGEFKVLSQVDSTVAIQGQTIKVKHLELQATNASFVGMTVDATISVDLSTDYPLLPLKQVLTITKSSNGLIANGTKITDVLSGGLPTVK